MVHVCFWFMAGLGTLMAIVSFILLKKKKGQNAPLNYFASMIVSETFVLPMSSANLMREPSSLNIFAFISIMIIIIVSAIYLAFSKSDE